MPDAHFAFDAIETQIVEWLEHLRPAAEHYWDENGRPGEDPGPYYFFASVVGCYIEILTAMEESGARNALLTDAFELVDAMLACRDRRVRDLAYIELLEGASNDSALWRAKPFLGGGARLELDRWERPRAGCATSSCRPAGLHSLSRVRTFQPRVRTSPSPLVNPAGQAVEEGVMRIGALWLMMTLWLGLPAAAGQTFTTYDTDGPRYGALVAYGGHGIDFDVTVDSPLLWETARFRASLGHGRWVGIDNAPPPAGTDPSVTRMAVSFLRVGRPDRHYTIRPYGGGGLAFLFPRGVTMDSQTALHLIIGIEGSGERWTVGPEIQLDAPLTRGASLTGLRPVAGSRLLPTARIGLHFRRQF